MVENVKEVIKLAGQHIGKINDQFSLHNDQLQIAAQHFHESKENHNRIVLYYRQMIEPLDKLAADMTYVVSTLKAQYHRPIPEDQAECWTPPNEGSSSYAPVAASQQDAQLTHVIELLKKQYQEIIAKLESFNDGILDSLNRTNTSFRDVTLRIEATAIQPTEKSF